jgi:hypothetical protein
MADYFSPTVIQPTIPVTDVTPLERLMLSHIFNAEPDDVISLPGPAPPVRARRNPNPTRR